MKTRLRETAQFEFNIGRSDYPLCISTNCAFQAETRVLFDQCRTKASFTNAPCCLWASPLTFGELVVPRQSEKALPRIKCAKSLHEVAAVDLLSGIGSYPCIAGGLQAGVDPLVHRGVFPRQGFGAGCADSLQRIDESRHVLNDRRVVASVRRDWLLFPAIVGPPNSGINYPGLWTKLVGPVPFFMTNSFSVD